MSTDQLRTHEHRLGSRKIYGIEREDGTTQILADCPLCQDACIKFTVPTPAARTYFDVDRSQPPTSRIFSRTCASSTARSSSAAPRPPSSIKCAASACPRPTSSSRKSMPPLAITSTEPCLKFRHQPHTTMAEPVKDLIAWLQALPENSSVGIDDGGLTLLCDENPDAYYEIGGMPEDEDEDPDPRATTTEYTDTCID